LEKNRGGAERRRKTFEAEDSVQWPEKEGNSAMVLKKLGDARGGQRSDGEKKGPLDEVVLGKISSRRSGYKTREKKLPNL